MKQNAYIAKTDMTQFGKCIDRRLKNCTDEAIIGAFVVNAAAGTITVTNIEA
ncbi:MAG: hypothetical protein V7731_11455 [Amphritea sp.]